MKNVEILLSTKNGQHYLQEQLDSITTQDYTNWTLLISDDNSSDDSAEIAHRFAQRMGDARVRVITGSQPGMARSFLFLLRQTAPGSMVAFCDQDDVWHPHKLSRALGQIEAVDDEVVAYSCRTTETDANLKPRKLSPWPARGPSFSNALVQNILPANSLVLSPAASSLLRTVVDGAAEADILFHDWWVYLVISGVGGRIILDRASGLYYRQHADNAIGASSNRQGHLTRMGKVLNGEYAEWINRNLTSIRSHKEVLSPSARAILSDFEIARNGTSDALVSFLKKRSVWRQTNIQDRIMLLLAWIGRL